MRRLLSIFFIFLFTASSWAQTTYFVGAGGNDANSGLTEALRFLTLEKAAQTHAANDTIYVKNSASYVLEDTTGGGTNSIMQLQVAGTASTPVLWRGYQTTITEAISPSIRVTIDANTNTLANAIDTAVTASVNHVFVSFRFSGGSSHGVDFTSVDDCVFRNCRFNNNSGSGLVCDDRVSFSFCQVDNNGAEGLAVDTTCNLYGCSIFSNTSFGASPRTASAVGCVFYDNGTANLLGSNTQMFVVNCTFDGNGSAIIGANQIALRSQVMSNIFFDCSTGAVGVAGHENTIVSDSNLWFSNTVNVSDFPLGENAVEADPGFDTDNLYRLGVSSNALAAGVDAGFLTTSTVSYIDIGAIQRASAGGGGGMQIINGGGIR